MVMLTVVCLGFALLFPACQASKREMQPLGEPETKTVDISHMATTLEYTPPTYTVWECPIHGEITEAIKVDGLTYCLACAWKRALQ